MEPFFIPFSAIEFLSPDERDTSLPFLFGSFEYDHITDRQISSEFLNVNVEDLGKDWYVQKKPNHAKRVAAIVKLLLSGEKVPPVSMELSEYNHNTNFVSDGHHRIRAFRYLKQNGFYADIGGFESLICEFKIICNRFKAL
jgi:hypothetical protein